VTGAGSFLGPHSGHVRFGHIPVEHYNKSHKYRTGEIFLGGIYMFG
jgi:hypothetical protein